MTASTTETIRSTIELWQHLLHSEAAILEEIAVEHEKQAEYWRKRQEQSKETLLFIDRLVKAVQEGTP